MAHLIEQMAYVGQTLGMAWGINSPQISPWKSGRNRLAWIGRLKKARCASSLIPVARLAKFERTQTARCYTALIPKRRCRLLATASKVVQPEEILEFYRDLTEVSGFELDTAGVLKGGRKMWALARTGQSGVLKRQRSNQRLCSSGHRL